MLKTLGLLTLVAAVVVIVGFVFGWFSFSKESQGAGSTKATGITFNVNEGRIKDDAEKVKQKTGDLVSDGKEAITAGTRVEGLLTRVEPGLRRLTLLQDEAGVVTVTVKDGARIEVNGTSAAVMDLRLSDRIVARCEIGDNGNLADTVIATRK